MAELLLRILAMGWGGGGGGGSRVDQLNVLSSINIIY